VVGEGVVEGFDEEVLADEVVRPPAPAGFEDFVLFRLIQSWTKLLIKVKVSEKPHGVCDCNGYFVRLLGVAPFPDPRLPRETGRNLKAEAVSK
jgi:hypothetical protein